jgi:hypothetical protein
MAAKLRHEIDSVILRSVPTGCVALGQGAGAGWWIGNT